MSRNDLQISVKIYWRTFLVSVEMGQNPSKTFLAIILHQSPTPLFPHHLIRRLSAHPSSPHTPLPTPVPSHLGRPSATQVSSFALFVCCMYIMCVWVVHIVELYVCCCVFICAFVWRCIYVCICVCVCLYMYGVKTISHISSFVQICCLVYFNFPLFIFFFFRV